MKQSQQLLSEQQAVSACGVSLSTLLRFAEAGYLQIQGTSADGGRMFSEEQLKGLFGSLGGNTGDGSAEETKTQAQSTQEKVIDIELKGSKGNIESVIADSAEADETAALMESYSEVAEVPSEPIVEATEETEEVPIAGGSDIPTSNEHLKTILNLQEQLLAAKEKSLADLETQCRWLQERIERLELKSERDQLLILSETQTLTRMLAAATESKSVGRRFLEWIGVVQPISTISGKAIEIGENAE
jgi:hypothetical protein